ncbi:DUF6335 family protein [Phormidium sp. CCY1219]|uniref:DUF6335 family protein n=1 Tax=Phormidium sp. CCY1219 TaxID=2886104 RepID=UPI002D1E6C21|nr:DUF6335 family protein [Phormidium sp. CCY1219]MEB3830697.1 DUF6335 family protein [Phormidium sp. CCY1219]
MAKNEQEDLRKQAAEEGNVEDLPQTVTESFGTGVEGQPGYNIGGRSMENKMQQYNATGPELSGGDVDAAWSEAENTGEEVVGGTAPTPDKNVVDELGAAVGLERDDRQPIQTEDRMEQRDSDRWELDPQSDPNYQEHRP